MSVADFAYTAWRLVKPVSQMLVALEPLRVIGLA
jgi:hypothetical protein